ncbi:MAG: hypothetical protein ACRCRP_02405 [Metamycoplasmataceae bacterium]
MSILLEEIRKKQTKEEYLKIVISNTEKLIVFCYYKYSNNIDEIIFEISGGTFAYSSSFFEEIQKFLNIKKDIFLFDEKTLKYLNILWEIIKKIEIFHVTCYKKILNIKEQAFIHYDKHFSAVWSSVNEAKYYLLEFDVEKGFQFKEEKYLIDFIDNKTLSSLFYLYKNSKSLEEKENNISAICKKTVFLFQRKDSPDTYELIKSKIGEEKTKSFCGKMHGYFRHTNNDSSGIEAQEWPKFDDNKKNEIMEEIFIDLLYIIALLRINRLLPNIK